MEVTMLFQIAITKEAIPVSFNASPAPSARANDDTFNTTQPRFHSEEEEEEEQS
jgi:hypothetical protein